MKVLGLADPDLLYPGRGHRIGRRPPGEDPLVSSPACSLLYLGVYSRGLPGLPSTWGSTQGVYLVSLLPAGLPVLSLVVYSGLKHIK